MHFTSWMHRDQRVDGMIGMNLSANRWSERSAPGSQVAVEMKKPVAGAKLRGAMLIGSVRLAQVRLAQEVGKRGVRVSRMAGA